MKRTIFAILSFFMLFAYSVSAQNYVATTSAGIDNAEIGIKFYNRTLYYPGAAEENPIYVHVTIRNTSTETLRFKLADDRIFSIDFKAVDIKNKQLPQTDYLVRRRTTSQTVYFRELALEPGEEYSFVENLKNYLDINQASVYYVTAVFYPELFRNKTKSVTSRRLTLEVRPSPTASSSSYVPVENETSAMLQPEEISPDKVVEQTIVARQKADWSRFFLYMDVESILKHNSTLARRYNTSSADERAELLRQYKANLMTSKIDTDIASIPSRYEIQATTYNQDKGTVKVLEWFPYQTYTERKLYTYYVQQRDGIWQIYNYEVDNLGTE